MKEKEATLIMYTNIAYLGGVHEDIVDKSVPLLVTAAGYYKVHSLRLFETERPDGRGDYQLLYVAAGKVRFYFDGVERIISKGNMVLFRPGDVQMYYQYAEDKPEIYWVHFTGSDVGLLLNYYQMPRNENVFFTGTSPDYQWMYRQMIQELQLKRSNYQDMLGMHLRMIFLVINRYLKEGNQIGTEMLDEIERATHYFRENYNQNIVIEQYAEEHLMTPCWFIQNFKQVTKVTPMQYIMSLRINNAMNMLDTTKYNVTQIAMAVGYDNSHYFSRLFKKYTGMTPLEYRNRNKEQDEAK